jgi:hypothetical protein
LQNTEVIPHYIGRCYDVWDDIWRFAREHPNDPDAERFTTPLTEHQLQERLAEHRRKYDSK